MKGYKKKLSKRNFYKHYSDYKWNMKIDDYCIKTYGEEVYENWKNKGGKVIFVTTSRTGKSINSALLYNIGCDWSINGDHSITTSFHSDLDLGDNKDG